VTEIRVEAPRDASLARLLREVRRIEAEGARLVASQLAGPWRSRFRGSGLEFEEVREYVAGDDPRAVDWNVTARLGRPHVKEFVDERERSLLFVLDTSRSMDAAFGPWSARAAAARVIAALALAAVDHHDRVGLAAGAERVDHFVRPQTGDVVALRLVRDALALPAQAQRCDLARLLGAATDALPPGSLVIVLSDFHSDGWRTAAGRCAMRHELVGVRFEETLPPARVGLVRLRDPEGGEDALLDLGDARVRAAIEERLADARLAARKSMTVAGGELLAVTLPPTADVAPIHRALLRFFYGRRERLLRR
jgi:uncharacterized protein (DUF58 family)